MQVHLMQAMDSGWQTFMTACESFNIPEVHEDPAAIPGEALVEDSLERSQTRGRKQTGFLQPIQNAIAFSRRDDRAALDATVKSKTNRFDRLFNALLFRQTGRSQ